MVPCAFPGCRFNATATRATCDELHSRVRVAGNGSYVRDEHDRAEERATRDN